VGGRANNKREKLMKVIPSKLHNITHVATKMHMILQSFVVLTLMCVIIELVWHVIL
jgi:hypothetical protein